MAGTMHEMAFVLAMVPDEVRFCGTRFYGGATISVRIICVGMIFEERAKGGHTKNVQGRVRVEDTPGQVVRMVCVAIVG